ncbi:hypothetical protein ABZX12_40900 [Kribbella sp. NPDC003505]|uniref:hypothetical protein n=1 Tax=Kribbella sp. NPDC003505 TaxID=3154448 RepID=UPI0033B087EC
MEAARLFVGGLAEQTEQSHSEVLEALSDPTLPVDQTLRKAAEMLHDGPNGKDATAVGTNDPHREQRIGGVEDAMRAAATAELLDVHQRLNKARHNPGPDADIPTGASIGVAGIQAAIGHLKLAKHVQTYSKTYGVDTATRSRGSDRPPAAGNAIESRRPSRELDK